MPTSFADDVAPIFGPFRGNMLWRFDLTDYEQVKANAEIIQVFITADPDGRMPPANFGPPLSAAQIATFQQWIRDGFPP